MGLISSQWDKRADILKTLFFFFFCSYIDVSIGGNSPTSFSEQFLVSTWDAWNPSRYLSVKRKAI